MCYQSSAACSACRQELLSPLPSSMAGWMRKQEAVEPPPLNTEQGDHRPLTSVNSKYTSLEPFICRISRAHRRVPRALRPSRGSEAHRRSSPLKIQSPLGDPPAASAPHSVKGPKDYRLRDIVTSIADPTDINHLISFDSASHRVRGRLNRT